MLDLENFLGNIAANLASTLIELTSSRLIKAALDSPKQKSLKIAYKNAFLSMLNQIAPKVDREILNHLETLLSQFVKNEQVSDLLINIALESKEPPIKQLRENFERLEFDLKTFPIDFDETMGAFIDGLERALQEQAAQPDSPLYNQVSLGKFRELKSLLLNNQTIIERLLIGISDLPYDYNARIQNFLTEYLGSPKHPVPFGGRNSDMAKLDSWLEDLEAPNYMLLLAPAGRGKSALLVRWSRQLTVQNNLAIVFIPISIRFRTNLANVVFPAMTARLAKLHGEKLLKTADRSPEVWRDLATGYLNRPLPDGRQLLLIVDGLDEAADLNIGPDLFPLTPHSALRVIVSARHLAGEKEANYWLRQLGWDRSNFANYITLSPLNKEGISDVLHQTGFYLDQLRTQIHIIDELYRLSEGDPLLVRLYLDDLLGKGEAALSLQSTDLQKISPGIEGYFLRWWEEQRRLWGDKSPIMEKGVQTILNILSCALGPLSQEEILKLAPSDSGINTWTLDEAIRPLARFVIGDGKEHGYIYSHSRLANYFYERLIPSERKMWESLFTEWGKETLDALNKKKLFPNEVSAYLLQYYGAHLERVEDSAGEVFALICDGWRKAWELFEGAYSGFLSDVEKAWRTAEKSNEKMIKEGKPAIYLAHEIRCVLCKASIQNLTSNIPANLIIELVKESIWSPLQGLAYAQQTSDASKISQVLCGLSQFLTESSLQKAFIIAQRIEDESWKKHTVMKLIPRLAELGFVEEALNRSKIELNENWYIVLAPFLPNPIKKEALLIVRSEKETKKRLYGLSKLVPYLSENLLNEAFEIIHEIDNKYFEYGNLSVLEDLIPLLEDPMKTEILNEALIEVRKPIKKNSYGLENYNILKSMIKLIPDIPKKQKDNFINEILEEAHKLRAVTFCITLISPRGEILALLSPHLSPSIQEKVLREAYQSANEVPEKFMEFINPKAMAIASLIPHLTESIIREIINIIPTINEEGQDVIKNSIAPRLAEWGNIDEAYNMATKIKDSVCRTFALISISSYLSYSSLEKVLNEIGNIGEEKQKIMALLDIIPSIPESMVLNFIDTAKSIKNKEQCSDIITKLAEKFPINLKHKILKEALLISRAIDDYESIEMCENGVTICIHIFEENQRKNISEIIHKIPNKERFAKLFLLLALKQTGKKRIELIKESVKVAEQIENEFLHDNILFNTIDTFIQSDNYFEAFEAILAIKNSQRQVFKLLEIFPKLPEKIKVNAQKKLFTAVQTIESLYSRVDAIFKTLPYISISMKAQLLTQALEDVMNFQIDYRQTNALIEIASNLDNPFKQSIVNEAWNQIEKITDIKKKLDSTVKFIVGLMNLGYHNEAFKLANQIEDKKYRKKAFLGTLPFLPKASQKSVVDDFLKMDIEKTEPDFIIAIMPLLAEFGYFDDALKAIIKIRSDTVQNEALQIICEKLPENLFPIALETAIKLPDSGMVMGIEYSTKEDAIMSMYHKLPEYLKSRALNALLTSIISYETNVLRAETLLKLIPYLTGDLLEQAILITVKLPEIEKSKDDKRPDIFKISRSDVITGLSSKLMTLSIDSSYKLWRKTLRSSTFRTRHDLLSDLFSLIPVIHYIGGKKALIETSHAVKDVAQWWP